MAAFLLDYLSYNSHYKKLKNNCIVLCYEYKNITCYCCFYLFFNKLKRGYMNIKDLCGSWNLVSFSHTVLETNLKTNIMGDNPNGTIIFTEDNCVSVIITNESRIMSKELDDPCYLYHSMMAYMGRYELNNHKCNFLIEVSWNPAWVGLTLQREVTFEGDNLIINTLPQVGIDGKLSTATLIWEKISNI